MVALKTLYKWTSSGCCGDIWGNEKSPRLLCRWKDIKNEIQQKKNKTKKKKEKKKTKQKEKKKKEKKSTKRKRETKQTKLSKTNIIRSQIATAVETRYVKHVQVLVKHVQVLGKTCSEVSKTCLGAR